MKYWLLLAKLAGAAWLAFAAAIFAVVASRFYSESGISAAFVFAGGLSAAHMLWLLTLGWNALDVKIPGRRQAAGETAKNIKSSKVRPAALAVCGLVSFSLVLLAVSYTNRALRLQDSIDGFPEKPGELVRDYIDELASLEGSLAGPKAAAEIYSAYADRYWRGMPPSMTRDEDQAYWALNKAISFSRQIAGYDPRSVAPHLIAMADIDLRRGNLDAATALYKDALAEIEAGTKLIPINDTTAANQAQAFLGLGKITAARRDFADSANYFEKALQAAEHSPDWNTDDQISALIGMAEAKKQIGDTKQAEKLANEAAARAEKSYLWHKNRAWDVSGSVKKLIPALVKKAEILRCRGKVEEAAAVELHADEVQKTARPHVNLDEKTQSPILEEVKGMTGCLLSIKYRTAQEQPARKRMQEKLSKPVLDGLSRLPWYKPIEQPGSAEPPHLVMIEFDEISIKSPDEVGLMTVCARGRCQTETSKSPLRSDRFIFVYLMKPADSAHPFPQVRDVQEVDPEAYPKRY